MRQGFLVVLLTLGTVGGFGLGLAQMRDHAHARRENQERHWAQLCSEAARKTLDELPADKTP